MAWAEKLKLNKQLTRTITEAGYLRPTDIQLKTIARIIGGQDVIAIAPEGCGKTTTYILAVLNRLNYNPDGVPKVLILVPEKESVLTILAQFELLNKNTAVSIVGLYAAPGMETQLNALADGADIVVATPDRARAIYLKLALNLNKIELLVIDDADQIVKKGMQLPIAELANSIVKCQHLVFAEVLHDKLHKLIDPFMQLPAIIEVDEIGERELETHPQILYHVPNFGTKLNLLDLFVQDEEVFTKTVIFVNTRPTAEKIYQSMQSRLKQNVAILNPWFADMNGFNSVNNFKTAPTARVLIVAEDEGTKSIDLDHIPFLLHFEPSINKDDYVNRVLQKGTQSSEEVLVINFATDLELSDIKKFEQAIGKKIPVAGLPDDLLIEKDRKNATERKPETKAKPAVPATGEAFHQKKASNSKTYNFSSGQKAKMNKKKKHG